MNRDSLQILICSCDKYQDVWPVFFALFFKYWPDCPYTINLIANQCVFNDSRVRTILIPSDLDWSSTFLKALEKIEASHVLVMMEDYLFTRAIDTNVIQAMTNCMIKNNMECLHVYPEEKYTTTSVKVGEYLLGEVIAGFPFRVNLQAAIWRKSSLESLVIAGENAWDFEVSGTKRSVLNNNGFFTVISNAKSAPISYYCTGVVRGKWMPGAVTLCRREGIKLDFTKRRVGYVRGLFREAWILQPFRHMFVFGKRLLGLN